MMTRALFILCSIAASLAGCVTVDDRDPNDEIRRQEELQSLIDQWQAPVSVTGSLVSNEPEAQAAMSYCDTLTHWKNNPQDFQGDTELFGLMLDMGCEHCWGC